MKEVIVILALIVALGRGNVCQDENQAMKGPISGEFAVSGADYSSFYAVLEHPKTELLYFIGEYTNNPTTAIIYQTDYSLQMKKAMGYGNSDLTITREISVPSGYSIYDTNIEIYNDLYFNMDNNTMRETCKLEISTSSLSWVNFGIRKRTNFVPINNDVLFIASNDTALDQHYLIAYNFSDPSNLVWKKSINCSASDWYNGYGKSIVSQDSKSIFTMITYYSNLLFYKLNATDGSPQNPDFILNYNSSGYVYSIKEFTDFIAVQIGSSSFPSPSRLILIDSANSKILKEYNLIDSFIFGIGRATIDEIEFIYSCGETTDDNKIFFSKAPVTKIDQLSEFEEDAALFTQITTNYQVTSTTSNPNLTSSTHTASVSTTISTPITSTDLSSSISPTFTNYVALWDEDYAQSVQSNSLVKLNFTWAWAPAVNNTAISFSLVPTDSHDLPKWVQLDGEKLELYLNKTPKQNEESKFYFSLQIGFDSEIHYKRFEITVEKWDDSDESWENAQVAVGVTTAVVALAASGVVFASASSLLSMSSVNSIFSTMNSLQLAILLPLIPDYFSAKVATIIAGMGFSMLSFDVLGVQKLPIVKDISGWISSSQTSEYLTDLGIKSGSSIINLLSLIAVLAIIGIVHFWIWIFGKWCWGSKNNRCKKFLKKVSDYFTFGIYIRVLIQASMFACLWVLSEMYSLHFKNVVTKVSFGISIIIFLVIILLIFMSFFVYMKTSSPEASDKYPKWKEYFNGIRMKKYAKLYSSFFLLLRLFSGLLLIVGKDLSSASKVCYFQILNMAFAGYLVAVRPFENSQDNIIEILNQILFCCLTFPLTWLNSKSDWSKFYESYYTYAFMASPLIVSLICFGYLVKTIVSRAKKMKCKKSPKSIAPKTTTPVEKLKTPRRGQEQEEDKSEAHHGNSAMRFESSIARSHANINRPSRRQDRNIHQHFRRRINHYNRMMGKRAELNISKNT